MAEYEQKDMTGALFNNVSKNPQAPALSGNVKIGGKMYRLAGWKNESKSGNKYISLRVSEPDDYKKDQTPEALEDDIPW